ncbi:MAG: hypothetical protein O7A71_05120 [Chloroflexi bacterium]|nr:hypothetical protein [Chloroflexota bacterium]
MNNRKGLKGAAAQRRPAGRKSDQQNSDDEPGLQDPAHRSSLTLRSSRVGGGRLGPALGIVNSERGTERLPLRVHLVVEKMEQAIWGVW